jgi:uncharacterized Tic20 family protein
MSNPDGPEPPLDPARGQPRETLTQDDKTWALLSHIGSLVAIYLAMGFMAPLLVMLVKGDSSPFARRHAVESLNFQISLLIYSVVATVIAVVLVVATFGIGLAVVLPLGLVLAALVVLLIVVATVKAGNGEVYEYPFTIRFIN